MIFKFKHQDVINALCNFVRFLIVCFDSSFNASFNLNLIHFFPNRLIAQTEMKKYLFSIIDLIDSTTLKSAKLVRNILLKITFY